MEKASKIIDNVIFELHGENRLYKDGEGAKLNRRARNWKCLHWSDKTEKLNIQVFQTEDDCMDL